MTRGQVPGKPNSKVQAILDETQAKLKKSVMLLKKVPNSEVLVGKSKELDTHLYQLYHLNPQKQIPVKLQTFITTFLPTEHHPKIALHNERVLLIANATEDKKEIAKKHGKNNTNNKKILITAATKVVNDHLTVCSSHLPTESESNENANALDAKHLVEKSNARTASAGMKRMDTKKKVKAAAAKKVAEDYASSLTATDMKDEKKLAKKRRLEKKAKEKASETNKGRLRKRNKIDGVPVEDMIEAADEHVRRCYYPTGNVKLDPLVEKKWDKKWASTEPTHEMKEKFAKYQSRWG